MKTTSTLIAIAALTTQIFAAPTVEKRSVVFDVSTEPNGQGDRQSFIVDRWKCQNFTAELDNQVSWAFVDVGLANGCTLYDLAGCEGDHVDIAKNNGNVLGPGAVNLTDVGFDKKASAFSCY